MNWKLIWKYTGLILAVTFAVGFLFGLINGFYVNVGTLSPFGLVIFTGLANIVITTIAFAKLSLKQRERTILHTMAVLLLCAIILLSLNVGLFGQPLVEWAAANVILLVTAAFGICCGTFLRPRELKPEANTPSYVVEIKDDKARIKTDKIQICLQCGVKNRLHKAVLIDLKPVCGKCRTTLKQSNYSSSESINYKFDDSEYVDVDSEIRYENPETNPHTSPLIRENGVSKFKQPAASAAGQKNTYVRVDDEEPDDELKNKLFSLVHHDREKAFRIVNSLRQKHVGRSHRWCWEKAVEDIVRDNR